MKIQVLHFVWCLIMLAHLILGIQGSLRRGINLNCKFKVEFRIDVFICLVAKVRRGINLNCKFKVEFRIDVFICLVAKVVFPCLDKENCII